MKCVFCAAMKKSEILKAVIEALEEELRVQLKGQEMAAEGATHVEAKAERSNPAQKLPPEKLTH